MLKQQKGRLVAFYEGIDWRGENSNALYLLALWLTSQWTWRLEVPMIKTVNAASALGLAEAKHEMAIPMMPYLLGHNYDFPAPGVAENLGNRSDHPNACPVISWKAAGKLKSDNA